MTPTHPTRPASRSPATNRLHMFVDCSHEKAQGVVVYASSRATTRQHGGPVEREVRSSLPRGADMVVTVLLDCLSQAKSEPTSTAVPVLGRTAHSVERMGLRGPRETRERPPS